MQDLLIRSPAWAAWIAGHDPKPEPTTTSTEDKVEVLSHKRDINDNLDSILKDVKDGNFTQLEGNILGLRDNVAGFEKYLNATIEQVHYSQHRPPNSLVAAKVLAVPELLEQILDNLEFVDLVRCAQVKRLFRDVVERLDYHQDNLFRPPDVENEISRIPPIQLPHLQIDGHQLLAWSNARVRATMKTSAGSDTALPSIGTRWQSIFISQPPIHKMWVSICGPGKLRDVLVSNDRGDGGGDYQITSDTGFTIGRLWEEARRLLPLPPVAHWNDEDVYNGNMGPEKQRFVHFEGIVDLEEE